MELRCSLRSHLRFCCISIVFTSLRRVEKSRDFIGQYNPKSDQLKALNGIYLTKKKRKREKS